MGIYLMGRDADADADGGWGWEIIGGDGVRMACRWGTDEYWMGWDVDVDVDVDVKKSINQKLVVMLSLHYCTHNTCRNKRNELT